MHDTLAYFQQDPVYRRWHHHELTFSLVYAFTENFILPLSHDEVVHGKGSLLNKMPGDKWQKLANLRSLYAFMWAHPGKKLLFMGCELAQETEWSEERSLDWHLLEDPQHAGMQSLVRDLNHAYKAEPALWEMDFDGDGRSGGSRPTTPTRNVFAFARQLARLRARGRVRGEPVADARARATGSACRAPAAGARSSTPTRATTAGPTSATSAASRPARSRGRASRSRPRSTCRRSARSGSCPRTVGRTNVNPRIDGGGSVVAGGCD